MSAFPCYHCLYTDCHGSENLKDKKMQFKDKKQFIVESLEPFQSLAFLISFHSSNLFLQIYFTKSDQRTHFCMSPPASQGENGTNSTGKGGLLHPACAALNYKPQRVFNLSRPSHPPSHSGFIRHKAYDSQRSGRIGCTLLAGRVYTGGGQHPGQAQGCSRAAGILALEKRR